MRRTGGNNYWAQSEQNSLQPAYQYKDFIRDYQHQVKENGRGYCFDSGQRKGQVRNDQKQDNLVNIDLIQLRSREEIEALESAFSSVDLNADGKVDINEYISILEERGIFTDRKQVEEMFLLADKQVKTFCCQKPKTIFSFQL